MEKYIFGSICQICRKDGGLNYLHLETQFRYFENFIVYNVYIQFMPQFDTLTASRFTRITNCHLVTFYPDIGIFRSLAPAHCFKIPTYFEIILHHIFNMDLTL